jgi:DNA-binding NtrC family response regulator
VLCGDAPIDAAAVRRCLPELGHAPPAVPAGDLGIGGPVTLEDLEKRHILATVDRLAGNKQAAADALGISKRTLWDKLARFRGEAEPAG